MQLSSKDVHDTVSSKQDVKTKEEWRVGLKESGTYFSGGARVQIPHECWSSYLREPVRIRNSWEWVKVFGLNELFQEIKIW